MTATLVLSASALWSNDVAAGTPSGPFVISNTPFAVTRPVEPNIVVTLDDSGSMARAYVPDGLEVHSGERRFKSAAFNPLYYDPAVTYPAPVDPDGSALATSFTAAPINGFAQGTLGPATQGTVNLSDGYRPTQEYNPSSTSQNFGGHVNADLTAIGASSAESGGKAYYYVRVTTNAGCTADDIDDEDCYSIRIVGQQNGPADVDGDGDIDFNDEKLNFARWYSFYRTRNLATISAAFRAFRDVPSGMRVAWQALNSCNSDFSSSCSGWDSATFDPRIREFDLTHRKRFYGWLSRLPASSFTPLRLAAYKVGKYYSTSGTNSPYAERPQVEAGTELACRPNFHLLMTDGVWNTNNEGSRTSFCRNPADGSDVVCGNADSTTQTFPDGQAFNYSAAAADRPPNIYNDNNSDSLADIAFYFWSKDLRTDLDNKVAPYIAVTNVDTKAQYWDPRNDPATWQHVVTLTVGLGLTSFLTETDIPWGGGTHLGSGYTALFGTAEWPSISTESARVYDLWHAAINTRGLAFSAESPQQLTNAMVSVVNRVRDAQSRSGSIAVTGTRVTSGSLTFLAGYRTGDWTGQMAGARFDLDANGLLQTNPDGTVRLIQAWEATEGTRIPLHGSRSIYSWDGTAGIALQTLTALPTAMQTALGSQATLDYLRGDQSAEISNGGSLRTRSTRLGDIVNSAPAVIVNDDQGYGGLPASTTTFGASEYATFVSGTKATRGEYVAVGANDGMLHVFNASTGNMVFSFAPGAVVANMPQLTSPTYTHRFYVDGSPAVGDIYVGGSWKTMLVGVAGAGAKSVFALDVTNPSAFGTSSVKWELTGASDSDLGYTFSEPLIVPLNDGNWWAVFGNGYDSVNQKAVLYLVRMDTAEVIRLGTGVGTTAAPNGLASPAKLDVNNDRVIDYIYGGDLQGNVWKFDLSSTDKTQWRVARSTGASGPEPVFTTSAPTGEAQPITAAIGIGRPPSGQTGALLLFGTGRDFAEGDGQDTSVQSIYGVLDKGSTFNITRSQLQTRTLVEVTPTSGPVTRNVTASDTMDWTAKSGWYIDLNLASTPGERVLSRPIVRRRSVIFTTAVPSNNRCEPGGTSWFIGLSTESGGRYGTDGLFLGADGVQSVVGMVKNPALMTQPGGGRDVLLAAGTAKPSPEKREVAGDRDGKRTSWREITR